MLDLFRLLFAWMPSGLSRIALAFVCVFVLAFFIGIILKIIELLRG